MTALCAWPRFGIISDYDGTLSPFKKDITAARLTPASEAALDRLAKWVTIMALVSGRSAADLRGRYIRPWALYYGNHGMEVWENGGVRVADAAQPWVEPLRDLLAKFAPTAEQFPGVIVEDKTITASVHYRASEDPAAVGPLLYAHLAPLCEAYGFRLSAGQFIWEIKPPVDLNKGTAAQEIVAAYKLDSALFLGDDVTDLSAMQRLRELRRDQPGFHALTVGVMHETSPTDLSLYADCFADGVDDTSELLGWLSMNQPAPRPSS
ncbi:MAG: trehalose-phosphatase [Chloroflexi bacterium]|nr:trehalose-phosphatase [Chloroflexota bacterium]